MTPNFKVANSVKFIISFIVLFLFYHIAEYMIVFENNITLFFSFQILFFLSALMLGKWYSQNGLKVWGLPFNLKIIKYIFLGIVFGIILYGVTFCLSILFGIEEILEVPSTKIIIQNSLPFSFGVLFTSFSEDILTRGLIFTHFKDKINTTFLIILSSTIYLLNHIYRLGDGIDVLLYLFLLGIIFFIPLLNTKKLWITGSMHWAGNVFFFVSHEIIKTQEMNSIISPNYFFSIVLLVMIPIVWVVTKKLINKV